MIAPCLLVGLVIIFCRRQNRGHRIALLLQLRTLGGNEGCSIISVQSRREAGRIITAAVIVVILALRTEIIAVLIVIRSVAITLLQALPDGRGEIIEIWNICPPKAGPGRLKTSLSSA